VSTEPAEIATTSATELLRRLESGRTTSVELVDALLERIERHDGALGAFVTVDADGARHAAAAADAARAAGDGRLLLGLPISLKDSFATAGLSTTSGRPNQADHVPDDDATSVARLRGAGAVVLGKTNLPTALSGQETANVVAGRTRNPWDLDRTPGGSSGGAAAALAAGLTPLELGSDSGGSIRQPAHCCGVHGHVATHGLLPQRGHLPSVPLDDVGATLDLFSTGPMARHPEDLRLVLELLAGADPVGPRAWTVALPPPVRTGLQGLRVAVVPTHPACPTGRSVRESLTRTADGLDRAGAQVVEAPLPFDVEHAMDVGFRLWAAASAPDDDGDGGVDDDLSLARRQAISLSHGEWLRLDEERRALMRRWAAFLEDEVDVALLSIFPVPALPHDPDEPHLHEVGHRLEATIDVDGATRPYLDQVRWNVLVGLAGLPATAVPLGLGVEGLPVGAQVVAAPHRDLTAIAPAEALVEVTGGFRPPPGWS